MEISLKPEYETMIRERLETGHYKTAASVVEQGLRLLAEQERNRLKHDELKQDIQAGINQLDAGEYKEYSSGAEVLSDIVTRGTNRMGK